MSNKKIEIQYANRMTRIPPYLFAELDRLKDETLAEGRDVISLGIGDPDLPTPAKIIRKLQQEAEDPTNHDYPSYAGDRIFKEAISRWYKRKYDIDIDAQEEVLALIGSKEGIGHIFLAFVNPGNTTLCPDPAYPVYSAGAVFSDAKKYVMPLLAENGFLPDLFSIPKSVAQEAKMMFINYPNNPTGATIEKDQLSGIVQFCLKNNILLCQDMAYSEMTFDGYVTPSLFSIEGGKEIGIEFHSLSKSFNMTGWRIGFAVGRREILKGLGMVKNNLDSGVFKAVQHAGAEALDNCLTEMQENVGVFKRRRDLVVGGLKKLGWQVSVPKGTFYLWVPIPEGNDSMAFAKKLLKATGVLLTPGIGFGEHGEGFVRIALTMSKERLEEALDRMSRF